MTARMIQTPYGKKRETYIVRAMECENAFDEVVEALDRAKFLLESPAIAHLVNGGGALDLIRRAHDKAHKIPSKGGI